MFALLLAGSMAVSAPVPKDKPKPPPDAERVLGAWDVYDGEKAVGKGTTTVWTFTAGMMHSNSGGTDWGVQLDPDLSPKHFTLANDRGAEVYRGIYEFDGDKLRIAYTAGPGVTLNVLVKAKEQPGK